LVRIVNTATGHVFYVRTFNHSTMSVAPGQSGSTHLQVAPATALDASTLYVVANGIPSAGTAITVSTATHDFNGDGKSDIAWRDTSGDAVVWLMNGAQVPVRGSAQWTRQRG
jgi:hypothetical protein